MPTGIPRRSAVVLAVVGRLLFTLSLMRLGATLMSADSLRALMPMGFMKSSRKISPG